jgi:hypothetical protein
MFTDENNSRTNGLSFRNKQQLELRAVEDVAANVLIARIARLPAVAPLLRIRWVRISAHRQTDRQTSYPDVIFFNPVRKIRGLHNKMSHDRILLPHLF